MPDNAFFMQRALQLSRLGAGRVAPNPMVGALLVQGDRILAEGWHRSHGGPHAEVECLRSFGDGPVPKDAVLYVTLEPCSHHGKTPPCADLLIERGVKHVVVAHVDPFPEVSGRGIAKLRAAGIEVYVGMDEAEARWTNRRFLTSVEQKRPYIILKWACSADGLLDRHPRGERGVQRISSAASDVLVHRWRSEEQAIMVGGRTVLNDDPALSVRHIYGRHPLRVVLDRSAITPTDSKVYGGSSPNLLFTGMHRPDVIAEQYLLSTTADPLEQVLTELDRRGIRSLLVEGGAELLGHFLRSGLWDEARVIRGTALFHLGTMAPGLDRPALHTIASGTDQIGLHLNPGSPANHANSQIATWPW
jgi:diaminohydroxyphosphoribosylaminopyrimidine deaminase / 5-amino-6-(5-phosphoribosylamino)uracil reductase